MNRIILVVTAAIMIVALKGSTVESKNKQVFPAGKLPLRPYTLSAQTPGYIIEDVWPTIYFGEEAVAEIMRKSRKLPWAGKALDLIKQEAELVIKEPPQLPIERAGWRHDFYSRITAEHLLHNPQISDRFLDPLTGNYEYDDAQKAAWVLLTHERTMRMMRSIGILYRLSGDERYAEWVADGMRRSVEYFGHTEFHKGTALYYQPLYDAAILSMLANAYSLTRASRAYSKQDHENIRVRIFEERMPAMVEFLKNHPTHNMACYVSAALASCGEVFNRKDWLELGIGEASGLKTQLERGIKTSEKGEVDGLWYEGTMFYHFYSLCPLVTLWEIDKRQGGRIVNNAELRRMFTGMFAAPAALIDSQFRLPVIGDLGAPRVMNLAGYRHLYEYAAGQLDAKQFGPILAAVYKQCGAPRVDLTALAYGPDMLPKSGVVPDKATLLPVAGIGVFRSKELTLSFRTGHYNGGHDHPDRLNIMLSAYGELISPDLGTAGYSIHAKVGNYYRSTVAHNTLFVDEENQTADASLEWQANEIPARARGVITDRNGVRFQRTVYFDSPYVVLLDEYSSEQEHRFGWVYHAYGGVKVSAPVLAANAPAPFGMPELPASGPYSVLVQRVSGEVSEMLEAVWSGSGKTKLKLLTVSDGPFEVTACRAPGQPLPDTQGTLIYRAPGRKRIFATVLQPYTATPSISAIALSDGIITVKHTDGTSRTYRWE